MAVDGGAAYEELGELYDVWCAEVTEDIPFYLGLAASLASALGCSSLDVVELGGGSGRIAVPLAAAGHAVTSIDASPSQLARCAERAHELGVGTRLRAIEGDMRELAALVPAGSADLVIAPFRALLHVTRSRDRVVQAAAKVLRPGGVFAFDVFHPRAGQVRSTDGRWIHRRAAPSVGGRWRFDERAVYTSRDDIEPGALGLDVDVRATWRANRGPRRARGGGGVLPDPDRGAVAHLKRTARLELVLVPAEGWRAAIVEAGFLIDGEYGWFDARPLEPGDDDSVWVARRDMEDS